MRRIYGWMIVSFFAVLMLGSLTIVSAQDSVLFVGDQVVVVAPYVDVHVQPDTQSGVAGEIVAGMVSRILAIEEDSDGNRWIYAVENVYGWVSESVEGEMTLQQYSDAILSEMVDDATAAIQSNPDDVEAYIARGGAYLGQRNFDLAIADYSSAIELSPDDGRLYDYRGKVYLDNKNYELAADDFDQAIAFGTVQANTYNRAAIASENLYGAGFGVGYYMQAIEAEPGYGLLYNNLANSWNNLRLYDDAFVNYAQAIEHDPYLAIAYGNRGEAYQDTDNYDAALNDFNMAIEIDPYDSTLYVLRGAFYSEIYRDNQTALVDFNRAIELDPHNAQAYTNRAVMYMFLGNGQQATNDLKTAVELDPTNAYTHFTLGSFYSRLGQYEESVESYTQAIEVGDRFDTSAPSYRAQVYVALDDYDNALADINTFFDSINADNPDNMYFILVAHFVRGNIYLYRGEYDLAEEEYVAAFAVEPNFAINYYPWGGGYRVTPLREYLIDDLYQEISANPDDTDLYLQLGNVEMEFGRWQEAIESYRRYLDSNPQPELEALVTTLEVLVS